MRLTRRLPRPWGKIVDWVATVVIAAACVLAFEAGVAKPFRIPSSSMEPTLHCAKPGPYCLGSINDRVIANRLAYRFGAPRRGQIVVFRAPAAAERCGSGSGGSIFVKRLVGMPGDRVMQRGDYVYIDGRRLREPYVRPELRDDRTQAWVVPAGHYFFLGDDRAHSCDSRTWGPVPRSSLLGPVVFTYWPPNRIGRP